MPHTCLINTLHMPHKYPIHASCMPRKRLRNASEMPRKCLGNASEMPQRCLRNDTPPYRSMHAPTGTTNCLSVALVQRWSLVITEYVFDLCPPAPQLLTRRKVQEVVRRPLPENMPAYARYDSSTIQKTVSPSSRLRPLRCTVVILSFEGFPHLRRR